MMKDRRSVEVRERANDEKVRGTIFYRVVTGAKKHGQAEHARLNVNARRMENCTTVQSRAGAQFVRWLGRTVPVDRLYGRTTRRWGRGQWWKEYSAGIVGTGGMALNERA